MPPPSQRLYGKLRRIMIHAHIHKSFVFFDVIDTKRYGFLFTEIMILYPDCFSFPCVYFPGILQVSDCLRLFCIDGSDRILALDKSICQSVNVAKLLVPIFMTLLMEFFLVCLQAIAQFP